MNKWNAIVISYVYVGSVLFKEEVNLEKQTSTNFRGVNFLTDELLCVVK